MEEKPPQRAGREAPRSRTPRAAFSTPEQPVPPSKPAERAPRRAAKAPPPVTFQPPTGEEEAAAGRKAAPRKGAPAQPARKAAASERAEPAKAGPAKTEPAKAGPAEAEPAKAGPAKAEPANAAPAKTEPVKAAKATPAKKAARKATKAPVKKAPPAQRRPAPSAAETETVSLPAEEAAVAVTPASTPEIEPPAHAARMEALTPQAAEPAPAGEAASPVPRTEAWAKIVADPGHAPELLALAATQTIGPRAGEWARRISADYPTATPDAVARLAVAQFTRAGGVSSVFAAVAGSYSPFALLGVNAFTYAELILHVAAAYGQDPTDPRRAVELLVLTGVHPSAEDAEAALASARQPAYEEDARLTDAVTRLGRMAAAQATVWTALKGLNRFFPGTAVLAAIITSRSGARTMGAKATNFYGRAGRAITSG
jgi:hypothetical protein